MSQDTLTVKAAGFDLGFKQVTLSQIDATAMRLCCRWVISLELKGCLFFNSDFDDLSRSVAACSPLANFFTSKTFQCLYLVRIVLLLQMYLNIVHRIHSFTEHNK